MICVSVIINVHSEDSLKTCPCEDEQQQAGQQQQSCSFHMSVININVHSELSLKTCLCEVGCVPTLEDKPG